MSDKGKTGIRVSSSEPVEKGEEDAKQGNVQRWKGKAPMGPGGFDTGVAVSPAEQGGNPSTMRQEDKRPSSGVWSRQSESAKSTTVGESEPAKLTNVGVSEPTKSTTVGASSEAAKPRVLRAEGLFPDVARSWSQVVRVWHFCWESMRASPTDIEALEQRFSKVVVFSSDEVREA